MKDINFTWLIVGKKGETLAGAADQKTAATIAQSLGGEVKENTLVEMTGELAVNKAGFWFGMGEAKEDFVIALRRVMGLPLYYPARTTSELTELGFVTITIKPATRPETPKDVNKPDVTDIAYKKIG